MEILGLFSPVFLDSFSLAKHDAAGHSFWQQAPLAAARHIDNVRTSGSQEYALVELLMASLGQSDFFTVDHIYFHNTFTNLTQPLDLLRVRGKAGQAILLSPAGCMTGANIDESLHAPKSRTIIAAHCLTV